MNSRFWPSAHSTESGTNRFVLFPDWSDVIMASFIGTRKEFLRYIGPHLRNLVQQITRKHRLALANCSHCGGSGQFEAAHVRGRVRVELVDLVLERLTRNGIVTVDIGEFEARFRT